MLRFFSLFLLLSLIGCSTSNSTGKVNREDLRLNQIQQIGSHNSYKKAIQPKLLDLIRQQDSTLATELDYVHAPLQDQLDLGMRQLELDLFHDPAGGKYSTPLGQKLLENLSIRANVYDPQSSLELPGFKVFHIQDIDFRSHCLVFQDCLDEIFRWSNSHPRHLPILITLNPKVNGIDRAGFKFETPLPFSAAALDSMDQEILEAIPRDKLITPDDIRQEANSLEEAVLAGKWPGIEDARGKFLFAIDAAPKGEIIQTYIQGHPSLEKRVCFVNSVEGQPEAAFFVMNNPIKSAAEIQRRVKAGYLVRTRADAGTHEARTGDTRRLEAALASGAQYISTDYYLPDPRFAVKYQVRMDSGVARCNPVIEGLSCEGWRLE